MDLGIDINKMEELMNQFYRLNHAKLRFCSHDREVRIGVDPSLIQGEGSVFCHSLRKDKHMDQRCIDCDRTAFKHACETKKLHIYTCHAGLTEVLVPIILDDKILGYFIMGKFLQEPASPVLWEKLKVNISDFVGELKDLENAFYKLKVMGVEEIEAAAYCMDMCAKYIFVSDMISIQGPKIVSDIKAYVSEHLAEDISISTLSEKLNFSKSYLSHLIKEYMGITLTEYIHQHRIDKAKELIYHEDITMKEVAERVGYNNQNYFNRVFKRVTGETPKQCRMKACNH